MALKQMPHSCQRESRWKSSGCFSPESPCLPENEGPGPVGPPAHQPAGPPALPATLTASHDGPAALTIKANAQTLILHSLCLKIARGLAAVRGQMPRSRLSPGDDSSAQTLTQPITPGELWFYRPAGLNNPRCAKLKYSKQDHLYPTLCTALAFCLRLHSLKQQARQK